MSGISSASPLAEGLRRALPIVLGYLPVGFAFGVLAVKNNIPPSLAVAMSVLMFSGSGQFVFAGMWGAGASALSIIAAVFIVNLRYLLQSAAESPWLAGLPRAQRFLLGLGLTDETDPVPIERDLMKLFPREEWGDVNHRMVWFGREVCDARKPLCDTCEMRPFCPRREPPKAVKPAGRRK